MKLHDLRPAPGSRTARTRVGRGIAAGKGKTAGRGTKGQKARAGSSIPPWFEGGQTPLHQRIPKLRGFRNPFKIEYEIVNLGRIGALVELGTLEPGEMPGAKARSGKAAPITVNQEILKAVGLVRTLDKPLKVLGQGDISQALFVVADAFSKSAVAKIEAAGGSVSVRGFLRSARPVRLGRLHGPPPPVREAVGLPRHEAAPDWGRGDTRRVPDRGSGTGRPRHQGPPQASPPAAAHERAAASEPVAAPEPEAAQEATPPPAGETPVAAREVHKASRRARPSAASDGEPSAQTTDQKPAPKPRATRARGAGDARGARGAAKAGPSAETPTAEDEGPAGSADESESNVQSTGDES